jgi:hypothetical protein
MTYRVLASSSCQDGDCPTFWVDDATGTVKVRGYDPTDPTKELDVTIPGPRWAQLVSQLPR